MSVAQYRHVAVVGAGMVGLSTAWFLQEHGVHVTVLDRKHIAAGFSAQTFEHSLAWLDVRDFQPSLLEVFDGSNRRGAPGGTPSAW